MLRAALHLPAGPEAQAIHLLIAWGRRHHRREDLVRLSDQRDRLPRAHRGADLKGPGVWVSLPRGPLIVSQPQIVAEAALEAAGHPVIEQALDHRQDRGVLVEVARGAEDQAALHLAAGVLHIAQGGAAGEEGHGAQRRLRPLRHVPEGGGDVGDELRWGRVRHHRDHHVARGEVLAVQPVEILCAEALDVALWADDALPDGVAGPEIQPRQRVGVHQPAAIVQLVQGLLDDDGPLRLQALEPGGAEEGGHQGEALGDLVRGQCVLKQGGVAASGGLDHLTHTLGGLVHGVGVGVALAAEEDGVLHKVGEAVVLRTLKAHAEAGGYVEVGGAGAGAGDPHRREAVGQDLNGEGGIQGAGGAHVCSMSRLRTGFF